MLHIQGPRSFTPIAQKGYSVTVQACKAYSSQSASNSEEAEFSAARVWFSTFKPSTLPIKIAETEFTRSSGPGGQKTNKTSSKAITVWPLPKLLPFLPTVLHQDVKGSRYYVASSNSIAIHCDSNRDRSSNKDETHTRLYEELRQLYAKRVPGVTSREQVKRIEALKRSDNAARLKMKKTHSIKKQSRTRSFGSD